MEISYKRHKFYLTRKAYINEYIPVLGDIVQEANSDVLEEFQITKFINETEVQCLDLQNNLKRYFFIDAIKPSEWEIKRRKKAIQLKKKQEKYEAIQENKKARAQRLLLKLKAKEDKKNKKFKFSKKKETIIKFV